MISCSHLPLWAQVSLAGEQRTNGKDVEAVFEPQRLVLQKSSAVIYDGYKSIVNGVVMSSDGWILTKASEIEGKNDLSVRVDDKKWGDVKVISVNSIWDLALLKVDAEGIAPLKWADSSKTEQGSWVVTSSTTSRTRRRISIGVISANAREIEGGSPVVMGVGLEEVEGGLKIAEVSEKTGAQKAGLKKGDVITKFEGVAVLKREDLIDKIKLFIPGDVVKLKILRDGKSLDAELELMARSSAFEERKSRNDEMSGEYSKRRTSFPMVLQTDIPLNERTVGGPLLNFEGEGIGMVIARADRAQSFAIPMEELRQEYEKMRNKVGD